jgi:hypothetical protein
MLMKAFAMEVVKIFTAFLFLCVVCGAASASPAAYVKAFPNGEGLAEFLDSIDRSKISCIKPFDEFGDTAILVVPVSPGGAIEVYEAEMNEKFEPVPNKGGGVLADSESGWGLQFWCVVPEGIPRTIVVVTDANGNEQFWSPAFSGMDGSLVTTDEFVAGERDRGNMR